jgi:hypothetical protein
MFVCLYVYCSPIQRHFQKQRGGGKKKASRGGDAAQKKNESRQLQASKRKTETQKLLKHHASNRIPSLSETNNTRKGAITGEEGLKTKLQRQLQRSRLSSANNTKSVCGKEKGEKSERGEGERRETTKTLFPRIKKQKSKKKKPPRKQTPNTHETWQRTSIDV